MPSVASARGAPPAPGHPGRQAPRAIGQLRLAGALALCSALAAAGAAGAFASPAAATSSPASVLSLSSQTSWVHDSSGITLGLALDSGLAPADLDLDVTLYSRITSRLTFEDTVNGQLDGLAPLSPLSIPVSSLVHGSSSSGTRASVTIQLPVDAPGVPTVGVPKSVPADQYLHLTCQQGDCEGVYPLQVSLVDTATSSAVSSFTTHLILVPPSVVPTPLRFAFVIPVGSTVAFSPSGRPTTGVASLAGLSSIETALSATPGAPLTLAAYPQLLQAMHQQNGALQRSLLSGLESDVGSGVAELTDAPYSAVDPAGLVTSGAAGEVTMQFQAGRATLDRLPGSLAGAHPSASYASEYWLGGRALDALEAAGVASAVVPDANVGLPDAWSNTVTAPFHVKGSTVELADGDSGLASHLAGPGGSVLRAHQLLADLAEIYFSYPDAAATRGVVLVAPPSWQPDRTFLEEAMRGLASSPIISTVELDQFFAQVPPGTCSSPNGVGCSPSSLQLLAPTIPAGNLVPATAVSAAREQIGELGALQPADVATTAQLSDAVLLGETAGMTAVERSPYLAAPAVAVHRVASELTLSTGRTVTVTSHSARIPISITSTSSLPTHVVLKISSPDLTLPYPLQSIPLVVARGVNVQTVTVDAPTSGDSTLDLQLWSPSGRTLLASGQLTIRSTVISSVAIGLTIGAGAFLLIWWGRSVFRRGRKRAGKHAKRRLRDRTAGPAPVAAP